MARLADLNNRSIFSNISKMPPTPAKETENIVLPVTGTPKSGGEIQLSSTTSIIDLFNKSEGDIYSRYSNRTGGNQPFFEVKPNSPARSKGRIAHGIHDVERISKWLVTSDGLKFSGEQFFFQSMNPTLETKIWNPLSIPASTMPYVYINRHASFASLSRLTSLLPLGSVGNQLAAYASITNYEQSVRRIPYSFLGRVANQSPGQPNNEMVGVKYADWGRSQMTKKQTWVNINPNRYMFPIASDTAGLPLSSRPSPFEEVARNIGLATQASRFTKATGFNPENENQVSPFKSMLTGILRALVPEPVRRPVAQILGLLAQYEVAPIKIFSKYNPSFQYLKGNVIRVTNEDKNDKIEYRDGKSQLTDILDAVDKTGQAKVSTAISPFTFQSSRENLDTVVPVDNRVKIENYLQTYGDISKKSRGTKLGSLPNTIGQQNDKDQPSYVQRLMNEGKPVIYINYGVADSGNPISADARVDKINKLDYGKDYPRELDDLIPFKFYHVNSGKYIIFRALISGISETFSPSWNSKDYIGRADPVFTYTNTGRALSFSFDIFPMSAKELKPLYRKLNYLIGLTYPDYPQLPKVGQYMRAPFVRLTIGDLYSSVYGIIDNLTVTYEDEGSWETQKTTLEDGTELIRVPRYINVSVGFKVIGNKNAPFGSSTVFIGTDEFIQ